MSRHLNTPVLHETDQARRMPVVAVVDAWNLRRQVMTSFGKPRHATVPGMIGALRSYGFEVKEVCFGLATEPVRHGNDRKGPSARFVDALNKNRAAKERWEKDSRAKVLDGRLTDRTDDGKVGDGQPTEKLVDVLCAVEICRLAVAMRDGEHQARGIISVSRDMDIIPAYHFAEEVGIPIWAAANDGVQWRHDDHRWLLLDEEALATAVDLRTEPRGHKLRMIIARTCVADTPQTMNIDYIDETTHRIMLSGPECRLGSIPVDRLPGKALPGRRVDLWPVGVDLGRGRNDFPRVALDISRRSLPSGLDTATVNRRLDETSVEIKLASKHRRLRVPPGFLLPGMSVMVHVDTDAGLRYVGSLDPQPTLRGVWQHKNVTTVQVTEPFGPYASRGFIEADGQPILLEHLRREHIERGARFPAFLTDPRSDWGPYGSAMAIGSQLPQPSK
ncbi:MULTISPECIES: hypothetical protein [unclassified Frankia]|uniref:hypothetical protein n=1 Tax=unclassified Frankia TaxID=2632575 RepID=UPI002AD310C7|nr:MULTISPECIES: hypothetical protein [unclassified Frankia]